MLSSSATDDEAGDLRRASHERGVQELDDEGRAGHREDERLTAAAEQLAQGIPGPGRAGDHEAREARGVVRGIGQLHDEGRYPRSRRLARARGPSKNREQQKIDEKVQSLSPFRAPGGRISKDGKLDPVTRACFSDVAEEGVRAKPFKRVESALDALFA